MHTELLTSSSAVALSGAVPTITVATVTTPAAGIFGWIGMTTTATVAVSPLAVIAVAGLAVYGGIKAYRHLQANS